MKTLSKWVSRLTKIPLTIDCPKMEIIGRDYDPPVFLGSGQVLIPNATSFHFRMNATPRDAGEALRAIRDARAHPHDMRRQFKLLVTEYDGTHWNCGWTHLTVGEIVSDVWQLSGPLSSLMTDAEGYFVSKDSSVELVYDNKLRLPISLNMKTTVIRDGEEVLMSHRPGRHVVEVAGTKVEFFHDPEKAIVWATAKTSTDFPHPFAENWISEPLSLLLGHLTFPRLVARNLGNRSIVTLRRSPRQEANLISSILGEDPLANDDRFWGLYRDILSMVAYARDEKNNQNFEANPLTAYYHEIIQASAGSNWVLCMTLASVAEGIAMKLADPAELKSDFSPDELASLRKHIKSWPGDKTLRGRILGSVDRASERGAASYLKTLQKLGQLSKENVDAWDAVRNRVMHGVLLSPWMEAEAEARFYALVDLVHKLALAYVAKSVTQIANYTPYSPARS